MDKETKNDNIIKLSNKERKLLKSIDKSSKWEDIKAIEGLNKELMDLDIYKDFIGLGCSRYLNQSGDSGKLDIEEMFRNCREAEKVRIRVKKKEKREEQKGQKSGKAGLIRGNIGAISSNKVEPKEIPSNQKKFAEAPKMSQKDIQNLTKTFNERMEANEGDIKRSLGDIAINYSGLYCLEGGIQGISSILYGISNTFKDAYDSIGYENGSWTMDDNIFNGLRDIITKCGPVALLYKLSDFVEFLNFKGWKKATELDSKGKPVRKGKQPKPSNEPATEPKDDDDDDDEDGEDPDEKGGNKIKSLDNLEPQPQETQQTTLMTQVIRQLGSSLNQAQTALVNANNNRLFTQNENQKNPLKESPPKESPPKDTPKKDTPPPPKEDPKPQENLNPQSSLLRGASILTAVGSAGLAGVSQLNRMFNIGTPTTPPPLPDDPSETPPQDPSEPKDKTQEEKVKDQLDTLDRNNEIRGILGAGMGMTGFNSGSKVPETAGLIYPIYRNIIPPQRLIYPLSDTTQQEEEQNLLNEVEQAQEQARINAMKMAQENERLSTELESVKLKKLEGEEKQIKIGLALSQITEEEDRKVTPEEDKFRQEQEAIEQEIQRQLRLYAQPVSQSTMSSVSLQEPQQPYNPQLSMTPLETTLSYNAPPIIEGNEDTLASQSILGTGAGRPTLDAPPTTRQYFSNVLGIPQRTYTTIEQAQRGINQLEVLPTNYYGDTTISPNQSEELKFKLKKALEEIKSTRPKGTTNSKLSAGEIERLTTIMTNILGPPQIPPRQPRGQMASGKIDTKKKKK